LGLERLLGFRSQKPDARAPGGSRLVRKAVSLCHSLISERGESSGDRIASEALLAYQSLDGPSLEAFFDLLIQEFSPDPDKVGRAGEAYREDPSAANLARLQRVAEPPRQELFRRLNMAANGTRVLLELRRRLLAKLPQNPQWEPIEADLAHLFRSWFNRGFLVLERIDWHTSAIILEKLIQHEAVHQIQGWRDLRRRLEADRRCYAFFHPALRDEPIIFIEVALTHGMSTKVQPLLNPDAPVFDPKTADCAMFYSITNCQEGLRGVPFGNFLIKKVAEDLEKEFPRLRVFATVSPIPGFREWLVEAARAQEHQPGLMALTAWLADPNWPADKRVSAELERELLPLCAYYLLHAKRGKEPVDPVARFHLRNGARLEHINWLGDTSPAGMQRSAGVMVNYLYPLHDIERNHELYTKEYRIAASRQIESLAKQSIFMRKKSA